MAGAAVLERLTVPRAPVLWRVARVREVVEETASAVTLVLDVDGWPGHVAGQHLDVRLTAEDGYQAQRSYSIASGPEDPRLELTVERIDDGEVSPYLTDELRRGDKIEGVYSVEGKVERPVVGDCTLPTPPATDAKLKLGLFAHGGPAEAEKARWATFSDLKVTSLDKK